MDIKNKFFWFSGLAIFITLVILSCLVVLFWTQLTPGEAHALLAILKKYFIYLFGGVLLLMGVIVFCLDGILHTYIIPISRLTEEAQLITSVNPSHRIRPEGSKDIMQLARIINEGADRFEDLMQDVEKKISRATSDSESEKNILAAVMAELPEGVLICNANGQVLLYNQRVRQFLGADASAGESGESPGTFIGLGRSIFGIIDRNCIVHALEEINEKLRQGDRDVAAYFVITGKENNLLRVETVPVLNQNRQFTGFVLVFYDITAQVEADSMLWGTLRSLITGVRHSSAGIRSAVEAILEYPQMDREQLDALIGIIHRESVSIGESVNREGKLLSGRIQSQWPLVEVRTVDVLRSLVKMAQAGQNFTIRLEDVRDHFWVKVCTYPFLSALLYILQCIATETGTRTFTCNTKRADRFIMMEFKWRGPPVKMEWLRKWGEEPPAVGDERMPLALNEILTHHDAEVCAYLENGNERQACFSVFLPAVEAKDPGDTQQMTILPESRPEFYDFDLFNQPGQVPELDNCPLKDLTYTVFDTETTGLNPAGGDEIISIGALRIVNGRLLRDDVFDRLINPQREVTRESVRFHGIAPEMLEDQPTIEKVLPLFHKFCEDTILVAHNAAFDMRMLQVKESNTGVRFIHPVLDTMLLSAVVHPAQGDHNLESIAWRLGIEVVGRHTALGDAIVTGEIFLKLLPLLKKKGVRTLKEARMASQNTYYARLKY